MLFVSVCVPISVSTVDCILVRLGVRLRLRVRVSFSGTSNATNRSHMGHPSLVGFGHIVSFGRIRCECFGLIGCQTPRVRVCVLYICCLLCLLFCPFYVYAYCRAMWWKRGIGGRHLWEEQYKMMLSRWVSKSRWKTMRPCDCGSVDQLLPRGIMGDYDWLLLGCLTQYAPR